MTKEAKAALMAKPKAAGTSRGRAATKRAQQHPGGPGAMASLRRAQEKLRALGIKLYKWSPEANDVKGAKRAKDAKAPEARVLGKSGAPAAKATRAAVPPPGAPAKAAKPARAKPAKAGKPAAKPRARK